MLNTRNIVTFAVFVNLSFANFVIYAGCPAVEKIGYDMFPEFCEIRCNKGGTELYDKWSHSLPGFVDVHHYCFGLAADHKGNHSGAIKQYDYVINRWPDNVPLLPRALYKKARIMEKLGNHSEAVALYRRATKVKPAFTPPYAALSDWAKGIGKLELAKKYLESGLAGNPDSRMPNDRLDQLKRIMPDNR